MCRLWTGNEHWLLTANIYRSKISRSYIGRARKNHSVQPKPRYAPQEQLLKRGSYPEYTAEALQHFVVSPVLLLALLQWVEVSPL